MSNTLLNIQVSKSELENLKALLTMPNGDALDWSELEISAISKLNPTHDGDNNIANDKSDPSYRHTATVSITPKSNSTKYKGSIALNWRFINLAAQWKLLNDNALPLTRSYLEIPDPTNLEAIKNIISAKFPSISGSVIYTHTREGGNNEDSSKKVTSIILTAKENSYVYSGTVTIPINITDSRLDISTLVAKPGFAYTTTG